MNRIHTGLTAFTATVVASLLLTGCSSGTDTGGADAGGTLESFDPTVIRAALITPQAGTNGVVADSLFEYVTEATAGKITFEPYWSNSLVPANEVLPSVQADTVGFGGFSTSLNPDELPVSQWLRDLGSETSYDIATPEGHLQQLLATWDLFQSSDILDAEFAAQNAKVLTGFASAPYNLACVDPVETLDEADGKRVHVGGGSWIPEAESLGMSTQFINGPEMYEALQRGVIDCVVWPATIQNDFSIQDVAPNFTPAQFSTFLGYVQVLNLDTWESFPQEVKQIFEEAAIRSTIRSAEVNLEDTAEYLADDRVTTHDASELDEALAATQKEALSTLADRAPSAVTDPEAFIEGYMQNLEFWKGVIDEIKAQSPDLDGWQERVSEVMHERSRALNP
ncbi:hypothetical protein AXA44_07660 [Rhodococcus sp. SC4]|uniref:hypothetical protein n=1 Tax=unclassified Rhodococcus (in: high G+C Gram-positive bacteria) TaxID=192944 RepID=UPI00076AC724|nr:MULTISPECIES: hypothetical protein [unclassified Rhodococcus (in: high G+C Gram-positive bacteria)]KXF53890.1 hypothetical protein AXA44_07660 [Rhodococcus sp. SC4]KXX57434.1 hypothetical protein AZG88_11540 [Rhodococcus sp. LB1]PBC57932.1 hypothetical protein CJ177_08825 [Rhodococcus sp. ACPA1]